MKAVGFSIFREGTGKSTAAVLLGYSLTRKEKYILLIDLYQQASAIRYLDLDSA